MLERIKIVVEIFAILAAGTFAFFTWGVNYLSVTQPNWALEFIDVNQYPAELKNGVNLLCKNRDCSRPTSCIYEGTLKVSNNGNRPLTLGETIIDLYVVNREPVAEFSDVSLARYLDKTCEGNLKSHCETRRSIPIDELDSQPVYPGQYALRPFSLEITNPGGESEGIVSYSRNNVFVVVATQNLNISRFLQNSKSEVSKASTINQNICNFRVQ